VNTKLAQIVGQATDVNGHLDRAKLYELLSLTPDDPVAICIEAFLATENSRRLLKEDLTAEHQAAEASLRRVAEDIADIAAEHSEYMAGATGELKAGREAAQKQMREFVTAVADQADKFASAAKASRETADKLRVRSAWLIFLVGVLAGASVALGVVLALR
jgi:ElaB/YqjD/DUF883 family membrane-anchored ribosome-binding protein